MIITEDKQKGVSLIITFFIMIIILAIVLSISVILYGGVKVTRNMGNSMVSFYAGESGIEKVLYYDRQVLPSGAVRGLCSMLDSCGQGSNSSVYCNSPRSGPTVYDMSYCALNPYCDQSRIDTQHGCDPGTCDDCTISFNSDFGNGRKYITTAEIYPDSRDGVSSNFEIDSKGVFGSAGRQIQILTTSANLGVNANLNVAKDLENLLANSFIYFSDNPSNTGAQFDEDIDLGCGSGGDSPVARAIWSDNPEANLVCAGDFNTQAWCASANVSSSETFCVDSTGAKVPGESCSGGTSCQ